jgi:hypothetical protein
MGAVRAEGKLGTPPPLRSFGKNRNRNGGNMPHYYESILSTILEPSVFQYRSPQYSKREFILVTIDTTAD